MFNRLQINDRQKLVRLLIYIAVRIVIPIKTMFVVRHYPLSDVGTFLFALSIVQLGIAGSDLGLQNFFSPDDRKSRKELLSAGLLFSITLASLIFGLVLVVSFLRIVDLNSVQQDYIRAISIAIFLQSLYFPSAICHSERRFALAALPRLIQEVAVIGILILSFIFSFTIFESLTSSYILGTIIGVIASWQFAGPMKFTFPNRTSLRQIAAFSIPFVGFQFLNLTLYLADNFALGYFRPAEELAMYTPVFQAVFAIVSLVVIIEEMLVPLLRNPSATADEVRSELYKMNTLWSLTACVFGYALWLQPMLFTKIVFGRSVPELTFTCKILGLTLVAKCLCGVGWLASAFVGNRIRFLRIWSAINLILMLLIGFPLIAAYGPDGAAFFWLLHTLFSIIPTAIYFLRRSPYRLEQISSVYVPFFTSTLACLLVHVFANKEDTAANSLFELTAFVCLFFGILQFSKKSQMALFK